MSDAADDMRRMLLDLVRASIRKDRGLDEATALVLVDALETVLNERDAARAGSGVGG